jgi:hypothetical protein
VEREYCTATVRRRIIPISGTKMMPAALWRCRAKRVEVFVSIESMKSPRTEFPEFYAKVE